MNNILDKSWSPTFFWGKYTYDCLQGNVNLQPALSCTNSLDMFLRCDKSLTEALSCYKSYETKLRCGESLTELLYESYLCG